MMFRNSTLQRAVATVVLAAFTSVTVAPLTAAAQTKAPVAAMIGNVPLIPLQARQTVPALPTLDANGIPTGKGIVQPNTIAKSDAKPAGNAPSTTPQVVKDSGNSGNALAQLQELARKGAADANAGKSLGNHISKLRTQFAQVEQQQAAVAQSFAATESFLKSKGLAAEILARHQAAVSDFNARSEALRTAMAAIDNAAAGKGNAATALTQLAQLLEQHTSQSGQKPKGKFKLNWGGGNAKSDKVAMTPREHEKRFPRTVQVAATGSLSGIALPDAILGEAPVPGDLAATEDAPANNSDIKALAASLGNNPVTIYNWVRNNIQYTPGYGAMQGATGTLQSRRGNDIDTASLLVALYRAANIPARYVYGTIEVPAERLNNWLGTDNIAAAQSLLTQAGIPHQAVLTAGQATAVQMEHVWVEAYVDFLPSRGAVNKAAQTWTPLDASFKQMQSKTGLNVRAGVNLNDAALFDAVKQGAACTADYGQNLNGANLQSAYADYQNLFNNFITQQSADLTVGDLLGSKTIGAQNYSILLGGLPYKTIAQGAIVNALPDNLRWQFRVQLYADAAAQGQGQATAALTASLTSLADKRITLSFAPASQADADTLASYMPKAHADGSAIQPSEFPASIPGYLIRVKAELRVDGQVVASGGSFVLGSELVADIGTLAPSANSWNSATFTPTAGDYQAIAIDAQGIGAEQVNAVKARLNATQAKLAANQTDGLTRDAVSGDILYQTALAYFATADANGAIFQRAAGVTEQRLPSYGRAVAQAVPQMTLGIVNGVSFPGVMLDIDKMSSAVAAQTNGLNSAAYLRQANERNAAYAHQILAKLFTSAQLPGDAASPVKAIAMAASQGQQVFAVTSENSAAVLPQIDLAATAATDLQNTIAAGNRTLVAQNPVTIGDWTGQGIAIEDLTTGAGAYRLTGEQGSTTAALYRTGGMGWLALAEPFQAATGVVPSAQAAQAMDEILAAMTGPGADTTRWTYFPGQTDVVNGLFLARIAAAQGSQPCDALIGILAANLGTDAGFSGGTVPGTPVITSTPVTTAGAKLAYSYQVAATDPKGAQLTYSLPQAPTGMTISTTGLVSWAKPVAGSYGVTVRADNGKAYAEQRYTLTVSDQGPALDATLTVTPAVINQGETVTINLATTGGAGTVIKALAIDGQAVPINVAGQALVTGTTIGAHQITATATDDQGTITKVGTYSVRDPADATTPVAQIASPADDAEVTAPVNVTGTASAKNLAYYQLLLRPAGSTNWSEIARGTQSVANGILGKLDPTQLMNGIYELALNVVDANGGNTSRIVTVDIYRDLKLGQFSLSFQDLNVDAAGIPIRVTRTYDTRRKGENLDFGYGWSVDYQSVQLRKNMTLGLQWEVVQQQFQLCLRPLGKRKVNITLPTGKVERFTAANSPECAFGTVPQASIQFTPLAGTTSRLELVNVSTPLVQGGMLMDDEGNPWNPKDYKLVTEDNYTYYITDGIGITQIKTPTGNTLTYGQNGIVHSNGQAVSFTRDANHRIIAITDPMGNSIAYGYSASGDLVSVTDRTGGVSKFSYDKTHGLIDYTDPRGIMTAHYVYDETGKLIAAYDATGKAIQTTHDTANNKEIVTDRNGNTTTYTYDAAGNVVEKVDALGKVTKYTYDALGNETSTTDANGKTTYRTFDPATGKQLTVEDPLKNTISWSYDPIDKTQMKSFTDARGYATSFGQLANGGQSISEPLGRTSTVIVDSNGNVSQLSVAGQVTKYTYDAKGNKTSETDASGNVTTYAYDANNREISRSWTRTVNGQTQTITSSRKYDAEGRVIEETDALGFTTKTQYNLGGQVTATIDPQGRQTSYTYDERGKLAKTTYPDGTVETNTYDAEGNKIATVDRQGRTTQYQYDALNRLVKTIYPDGSTSGMRYDAVGRVEATIDANHKETTNKYDDAGRLWKVISPDLKETVFGYDANGNRTSVTDANQQTTTFKYDELNRLVETKLPNGKIATIVWNVNGTKKSETDFSNNTTDYGYDAMGRLNKVTQTNGATAQVTSYGFDTLGNKVSQTDAEGRTTRWEYDQANRVTSRTLPNGEKETFQYDAVGNLTAKTDFAGKTTSYGYNTSYQPNQSIRPDGSTITTTYTTSGQVATVTINATANSGLQSGTTAYQYDAQDRLTRQTNPDGSFIAYGYDANGNITQRSTNTGTVNYAYDENQRLKTVTDAQGKTTTYTYEATGKLDTVTLPNGTSAKYGYDINGRLTQLIHSKGSQIVTGTRYTLADNGQRTKAEEFDGQSTNDANGPSNPAITRDYQYDGVGRLKEEKVTQRGGTVTRTTGYTYDKVGNRKTKTETTPAGTETIVYSYDANDRLTSESKTTATGSTVLTTMTWDANGNLKSKTVGSSTTFYTWNADNRLLEVKQGASEANATTIAKYSYDANGNRVQKQEGDQTTTYLTDATFPYAQVLQENTTQGQTNIATTYVWGATLIAQNRAGQQSYYLADALGSVKALTDGAGAQTDSYSYEAFGSVESKTGSTTNAYRYTGEYFDEAIGLQYNRARWYDASVGRFISMDTYPGKRAQPASLHKYLYADADPVLNRDPSGMFTLMDVTFGDFTNAYNRSSSAKRGYDSFDGVRQKLCKGTDFVLSPLQEAHHLVPKFMGGKEDQKLMNVSENIHRAFHKLLGYALVINGFPAPSKGKKNFQDYMSKNPKKKDEMIMILLATAEFVDDACVGVKGYEKIKPAVESALKVIDIFVF